MKRFVAVFGVLLGLCPLWGNGWELVYPEIYPDNDIELLSIATSNDIGEYLVGSEDGKALIGYRGLDQYKVGFSAIQLPVPFDITAAVWIGEWMIGGPKGAIAFKQPLDWGEGPPPPINLHTVYGGWDFAKIDTDETIRQLVTMNNRVLALTSNEFFVSEYRGTSWEAVTPPFPVNEITVFNSCFYTLHMNGVDEHSYLIEDDVSWSLYRSEDGYEWEEVWRIDCPNEGNSQPLAYGASGMMILSESFKNGIPQRDSQRLYIWMGVEYTFPQPTISRYYFASLSTKDAQTLLDHGSQISESHRAPGISPSFNGPWNPLDLPDVTCSPKTGPGKC